MTCLLYISVVRFKNETTAQCVCANEYRRNIKNVTMKKTVETHALRKIERTLINVARILNSSDKKTCIDRDVMHSLEMLRKMLNDEELTGYERVDNSKKILSVSEMQRFRTGDILIMEATDSNIDDMIFIYKGFDDGGIKRFYSTSMVNEKTYRFPHYDYGRYLVTKKELESENPIIRYANDDEIEALKHYLEEDNIVWDHENLELTVVDNEY